MFTVLITPVAATENQGDKSIQPTNVCSYTKDPIPEEGKVILLEDNSLSFPSMSRSTISTVNVNKVYSVRIQDNKGSCVSSARVTVSGSYKYNKSTNQVTSSSLKANVTSTPVLWTVGINSQWQTISGPSLKYSIYYSSYVNDPYSCLIGGGYWYSGATFTIR